MLRVLLFCRIGFDVCGIAVCRSGATRPQLWSLELLGDVARLMWSVERSASRASIPASGSRSGCNCSSMYCVDPERLHVLNIARPYTEGEAVDHVLYGSLVTGDGKKPRG